MVEQERDVNCPKCRRKTSMLRDVSNTRFCETVHTCKCGYLLVSCGNPNAIMELAIKNQMRVSTKV
jgi:hypothetical protein